MDPVESGMGNTRSVVTQDSTQPVGRENGPVVMDSLDTVTSYTSTGDSYGPSSSMRFLHRTYPEVLPPRETVAKEANRSRRAVRHAPTDRLREVSEGAAVLPRRKMADEYLYCFWEFVHPLCPVLHKPSVLRQYEGALDI